MNASYAFILLILLLGALGVVGVFGLLISYGIGTLAGEVDRDEDPMEAEDRISTIKAALQEESTAHPHVPARNYWSAP